MGVVSFPSPSTTLLLSRISLLSLLAPGCCLSALMTCSLNQVAAEIRGVLDLVEEVLSTFGFSKYEINLSTRPEKSVGEYHSGWEGAVLMTGACYLCAHWPPINRRRWSCDLLSVWPLATEEYVLSSDICESLPSGDEAFWKIAEDSLVDALGSKGWAYKVDAGGGAFYGPKIDIKIQDAIGRKWQCSTIQAGPCCCPL